MWYIHLYIYKYHQLPEKKKISINGLVIGLKFGKRTARKFRKKNENRTKSTIFLKINKKSEKLTCPLKLMESTNHLGNFLSEQSTKIGIRMSHRLRPPVLYCEQHGPPENLKKKNKKRMSHSDRYWGENKKIEEIDMKMYEFLEKSTISAMIYSKYKT